MKASSEYATWLREAEREYFTKILSECRGNQSRAAQRLGLNRATLRKKLKVCGLYQGGAN